MAGVNEPRGVDSDRVDGGRRPWRPFLVALILGVLIGGALGGYYGSSKARSYQASTALSVQPDSVVNPSTQSQNAPTLDAPSYIQSQLVVLNGSQLAELVQRDLKLATAPAVSATEIGQTYVVQVTATAASKQQAIAIATVTGAFYAKQRSQQLTSTLNASISSTATQIATVSASLAAAERADTVALGISPTATALQTEYVRLLQVSSSLKLALPQVNQVVTVLSPASADSAALSPAAKDGAGGALLGAILGLGLLIALRRTVSRIRTAADLASLGVPLLLPVLPRRRVGGRSASNFRSSAGRLLAARLTGRQGANPHPIIVVGANGGVGTSYVAATLAAGLAERGPVLLVLAAEMINGEKGRQLKPEPDQGGAKLTAFDPSRVSDLIELAQPTGVSGVWVLPCTSKSPGFTAVAPSMRADVINDMLYRASAAGWQIVVDAPALSDSDLAVQCAREQGVAALVVGRGATRTADVLSAAELFEANDSPLEGVILNDVPRTLMSGRRRRPSQPTIASPPPQPAQPREPVQRESQTRESQTRESQLRESQLRESQLSEMSLQSAFGQESDDTSPGILGLSMAPAEPRGGRRRAPSPSELRHRGQL
jgi:Mrp family chromosome partitioning ATPase